jgi:predicted amidohydrolase
LFLPEASDYIGGSAAETVSLAAPLSQSLFVNGLRAAARAHGIAICVGIHEPSDDGTKVKNCLLWISDSGDISQKYQKIHLFDVDLEDGPRLKESRYEVDSIELHS